jgi:hypothetical protein
LLDTDVDRWSHDKGSHFLSLNEEDRFCGNYISSEQWYGKGKRNESLISLTYILILLQFISVSD